MKKFDCIKYFDIQISDDITLKDFTIYSNLLNNLLVSKKRSSAHKKSNNNYDDDDDDDDDNDDDDADDDDDDVSSQQEEDQKAKEKAKKSDTEESITINEVNYKIYTRKKIAKIVEFPKSKGEITIPKKIKFKSVNYTIRIICDNAFANSKVASLSFAKSSLVRFQKFWCKGADKLNVIELDSKPKEYSIKNGCLIRTKNDKKTGKHSEIILFVPRNYEGEFSLFDSITRIAHYSFSNCQNLTSFVSECNSLKKINSYAFYGCPNLKSKIYDFINYLKGCKSVIEIINHYGIVSKL